MVDENPFTPSFGEVPRYMAGRDAIMRSLKRAFESRARRPELCTLISGARGTGKTALLARIADEARECGWLFVRVSCLPGLLEEIYEQACEEAADMFGQSNVRRLTAVGVGQLLNLEWEHVEEHRPSWAIRMSRLLKELARREMGLVIAVDEVRPDLDDMVRLASVYQQFVTDGYRVSLLMAGLPSNLARLQSEESVTFLRRAHHCHLGRVADNEIRRALSKTIADGGRESSDEEIAHMVREIDGFPFMMQLVGYGAWDANPGEPVITKEDVEEGVRYARDEMAYGVIQSTLRELSPGDRKFLEAMLDDELDSRLSDIARRLGKSSSYVSQYKSRLLEAGVIGERERGVVGFDLPVMKDYLRGLQTAE